MIHDDIERILDGEEEITPSPEFLPSVMAAVERETIAPEPLRFPWLRALPGIVASIAALAVAAWHGIGTLRDPAAAAAFDEQLRQLTALAASFGLQWAMLAVAITIVCLLASSSLVRARVGA